MINKPKRLELEPQQVDALLNRLQSGQLTDEDRHLFSEVLQFSLWLQQGLEQAEVNLPMLRQIFGVMAEKKSLPV